MRKYTHCANCSRELGERFVMVRDNYLQAKYFEQEDGSDNAFCSNECACESLMIEEVENIKEDEDEGR